MSKCSKCNKKADCSYLCENPACPIMPCCGEKQENCSCTFSEEELYIQDIIVAFENAKHYKYSSFMLFGKEVTTKRVKFVLKHLN